MKYIRRHPVDRLTIAGGFAKLCKLGAGLLDLHSKRGSVDLDWLAERISDAGGDAAFIEAVRCAETAGRALQLAREVDYPIGDLVAVAARKTAREQITDVTAIEVLIFDRAGELVGRSDG